MSGCMSRARVRRRPYLCKLFWTKFHFKPKRNFHLERGRILHGNPLIRESHGQSQVHGVGGCHSSGAGQTGSSEDFSSRSAEPFSPLLSLSSSPFLLWMPVTGEHVFRAHIEGKSYILKCGGKSLLSSPSHSSQWEPRGGYRQRQINKRRTRSLRTCVPHTDAGEGGDDFSRRSP